MEGAADLDLCSWTLEGRIANVSRRREISIKSL